jgi:hypothetical protein
MEIPACAIGRLEPDGPWIGVAPTVDDGYALTLGVPDGSLQLAADPADLAALALAWFEESLVEPPEALAATLGDVAAIVRHAAERVTDPDAHRAFDLAVDAIDDGLAADVVIDRLARALGDGVDAVAHLRRRTDGMRQRA